MGGCLEDEQLVGGKVGARAGRWATGGGGWSGWGLVVVLVG